MLENKRSLDEILAEVAPLYLHATAQDPKRIADFNYSVFLEVMRCGAIEVPEVDSADDWPRMMPFMEKVAMTDPSLSLVCCLLVSMFWGMLKLHANNSLVRALVEAGYEGSDELYYGAFALSEWGHGTTVAKLELLAHLQEDGSFVISSGKNSAASKMWSGGGVRAMHAIVCCRVKDATGHDFGVFPFFLRLRNARGECIPGVRVHSVGVKSGLNGIENACIIFDDVPYPKEALLGNLNEGGGAAAMFRRIPVLHTTRLCLTYGMIGMLKRSLAQVVAFATHREVPNHRGEDAPLVTLPAYCQRLLAIYAKIVAINIVANEVRDSPEQDASLCSALKIESTKMAVELFIECKDLTGAYGFTSYAGFGEHLATAIAASTGEGDNWPLAMRFVQELLRKPIGYLVRQRCIRTAGALTRLRLQLLLTRDKATQVRIFKDAALSLCRGFVQERMRLAVSAIQDAEQANALGLLLSGKKRLSEKQLSLLYNCLEKSIKEWDLPFVATPNEYFDLVCRDFSLAEKRPAPSGRENDNIQKEMLDPEPVEIFHQ